MPDDLKILVIEDNPGDVALLKDTLAGDSHLHLTCVASLAEGVAAAQQDRFNAVLLDLTLPDSSGLGTIALANEALPALPIVVMTGVSDEQTALQAIRQGAQDYLFKGAADRPTILRAVRYAIDRKQTHLALQQANDELERKVQERTAELRRALDELQEEILQRLATEEELRRAEREVLRATESEQHRLGRDLHDSLGQNLTGLSLLAEGVAAVLRTALPEKVDLAAQMVALAKNAVEQVRAISKGLNPVGLGQGGLVAGLVELAKTVQAQSGIVCECRCDKSVEIEDAMLAMHLYRIAQEAANNAVKHSRAKHIRITLKGRGAQVFLEVRDDGVGMGRQANKQGMGMRIMKYRASVMNGTLKVRSRRGRGAVVLCSMPRSVQAIPEPQGAP
ncbi:MAG: response regulator [Phycisphaerae bacterium]|jgi:signal transduction histidine kinase